MLIFFLFTFYKIYTYFKINIKSLFDFFQRKKLLKIFIFSNVTRFKRRNKFNNYGCVVESCRIEDWSMLKKPDWVWSGTWKIVRWCLIRTIRCRRRRCRALGRTPIRRWIISPHSRVRQAAKHRRLRPRRHRWIRSTSHSGRSAGRWARSPFRIYIGSKMSPMSIMSLAYSTTSGKRRAAQRPRTRLKITPPSTRLAWTIWFQIVTAFTMRNSSAICSSSFSTKITKVYLLIYFNIEPVCCFTFFRI